MAERSGWRQVTKPLTSTPSERSRQPEAAGTGSAGVPFATTVDYPHHDGWRTRAHLLNRSRQGPRSRSSEVSRQLRHFSLVLKALRQHDALVLDSSSRADVVAAAAAGLLPRRSEQRVVLMGCMWQPDSGLQGALERLVVKLADRVIDRYALQSRQEASGFSASWRIDPGKLRFVPYFWTILNDELDAVPSGRGHVFSGGDSHRDYAPVVEAARQLPHHRFVLATGCVDQRDLPPNVRAGHVSRSEFMALLLGSAAVVVPLRRGLQRAAGQQTYLNAMLLGKPTVVSDAMGVRDYVRPGTDALVVDGSAESYREALSFVFDPVNAETVDRMKEAAREVKDNFSFERHADGLLEILDELVAE